jgi:hypothetical protein
MLPPEILHYIVDSGILLLLWRGLRTVNRLYDILLDFPPHVHDNGLIRYPKGYEPGLLVQHDRGRTK